MIDRSYTKFTISIQVKKKEKIMSLPPNYQIKG